MPTPLTWTSTEETKLVTKDYNALLWGTHWARHTLTFSFGTYASSWSTDNSTGYGPTTTASEPFVQGYRVLSSAQEENVRSALSAWSHVANIKFAETKETLHNVGDLRFTLTKGSETGHTDAQAWAYLPGEHAPAGDVWFNSEATDALKPWVKGSYNYLAVVHEIGHAIGLKHPFAGAPDNPDTLQSGLDSHSFTIMSYSADPGRGHYFDYEPTTPMILDIQAIQHIYGKNTEFHNKNDTYTFKAGTYYHQTIWDAGGTDTFVYDGNDGRATIIDLGAGYDYGSSMGHDIRIVGTNRFLDLNIWIAFGTQIENARGSNTDSDRMYGNIAENILQGRGGNDTLDGREGKDTLVGGEGADTLTGGGGADRFRFSTKTGVDTLRDFSHAQDDILQFENAVFKQLTGTGQLSAGNFRASASGDAADSNDYVLYETDTGKVWYDADGSGAGAKELIAVLGTTGHHPTLVASDIFVV